MKIKTYIFRWIYPHRRGIMGTVIFHLLLAIFLLSMEIARMDIHTEMELVFDAPDPEEVLKRIEEQQREEDIRKKSSAIEVERMLRSIAANKNIPERKQQSTENVRDYVAEVMRELEQEKGADRYKAGKDRHYDQDSLQYLRDRREKELDSLKSTFYVGESSVTYDLIDRYARFMPIPVFKCEYGGKVVVEITVDRKGVVQKAIVIESRSQADDCLWKVAVDAAGRSRFNERYNAPALQKGTITYLFVKQ